MATRKHDSFLPLRSVSIHATRVGGDLRFNSLNLSVKVSIHATRVGGDLFGLPKCFGYIAVSIHATRVGGDFQMMPHCSAARTFLSTPPVWVATYILYFLPS